MLLKNHWKLQKYLQVSRYLLWYLSLISEYGTQCVINKWDNRFSKSTLARATNTMAPLKLFGRNTGSAGRVIKPCELYFTCFMRPIGADCGSNTIGMLLKILRCLAGRQQNRLFEIIFELLDFWGRNQYFSLSVALFFNILLEIVDLSIVYCLGLSILSDQIYQLLSPCKFSIYISTVLYKIVFPYYLSYFIGFILVCVLTNYIPQQYVV